MKDLLELLDKLSKGSEIDLYDAQPAEDLKLPDLYGPHVEMNRPDHLVLQAYSEVAIPGDDYADGYYYPKSNEATPASAAKETKASAAEVIRELEERGGAFVHSAEYFAALKEEAERMSAYKTVVVTGKVGDETEAEIIKNPWKFLGLDEGASLGDLRITWMTLARIWHADMMRPEDTSRFKLIFGDKTAQNFVIEDQNPDEWIKEALAAMPPPRKTVTELEEMDERERAEYENQRATHQKKEEEYQRVKNEMVERANRKLAQINLAYRTAKAAFAKTEEDSFAGFTWIEGSLSGILGSKFHHKSLPLEGGAELRQDTGQYAFDKAIYIAFDMGDVYLADSNDFRQRLPLKAFFAWTELAQLNPLSPLLLNDLATEYSLNESQIEQLRLMLTNRESYDFILETLGIKEDKTNHLWRFVDLAYQGPTYSILINTRDSLEYPLGVEMTPDGSMKFYYQNQQIQCFSDFTTKSQTSFTPTDMNVMRCVAYGPLLQGV